MGHGSIQSPNLNKAMQMDLDTTLMPSNVCYTPAPTRSSQWLPEPIHAIHWSQEEIFKKWG